jgi:hypothetical protein
MPAIVTLVIRGLVSIALIGGGIFCVYSAFRMMRSKKQPNHDPAEFSGKIGALEFKIASGTLGALILCISAIWAGFGYLAVPTFHLAGEGNAGQRIDVASAAPLSIETAVPIAESSTAPVKQYLAEMVTNAGGDQVSAATIAIPSNDANSLAGSRANSIRDELISAGVSPSKIHIVQSSQVAGNDATNAKVRIDFKDHATLQALGTNGGSSGNQ